MTGCCLFTKLISSLHSTTGQNIHKISTFLMMSVKMYCKYNVCKCMDILEVLHEAIENKNSITFLLKNTVKFMGHILTYNYCSLVKKYLLMEKE